MANDIGAVNAPNRDFRSIVAPMLKNEQPTANPKDSVAISGGSAPKGSTAAAANTAAPKGAKTAQAPAAGGSSVPTSMAQIEDARPMSLSQAASEAAVNQEPLVIEAPQVALEEHLENYVPDLEKSKLIETPTTVENLGKLGRSLRLNENVLMVGPTGVGKTSLVKYLAALTNNELRRINLSDMTDNTEL
ncbi:MAG: AAA family ATPase, partial [Actinobacteria bacterium]|nr:AAA family ATPase [Actinomycetota bacterium]